MKKFSPKEIIISRNEKQDTFNIRKESDFGQIVLTRNQLYALAKKILIIEKYDNK